MRRTAFLIIIALCTLTASAKLLNPDIDPPRQVIASADSVFAANDGKGVSALAALMAKSVAEESIDRAQRQACAEELLRFANVQPDREIAALAQLYAARIVSDIYRDNTYAYDSRTLPPSPRPADMTEWSGEMFKTYLDSLYSVANSGAGPMPIGDLKEVIIAKDQTATYFPTQADFIASELTSIFYNNKQKRIAVATEAASRHKEGTPGWYQWQSYIIAQKTDDKELFDAQMALFDSAKDKYDALIVLYNVLKAGDLDRSAPDYLNKVQRIRALIPVVKGTWMEGAVTNYIATIFNPAAEIRCPETGAPGVDFQVKISEAVNIDTLKVRFCRFDTADKRDDYKDSSEGKPQQVFTRTIYLGPSTPAFKPDTTLTTSLPQGFYTVDAGIGDEMEENLLSLDVNTAIVSVISDANGKLLIVSDAVTGEPATDAIVKLVNNQTTVLKKRVPKSGLVEIPADAKGSVEVTYDGITMPSLMDMYAAATRSFEAEGMRATITTSQGVYRPGDTVKAVAVVMGKEKPAAEYPVAISLHAPGEVAALATVESVTDSFGRVSANLVIPGDVSRTGSFRIKVAGKNLAEYQSFMVSDFKLHQVQFDSLKWEVLPAPDSVIRISGRITDASGFPYPNVDIDASYKDFNDIMVAKSTGTTTDGTFALDLPSHKQQGAYSYVKIEIVATAPDGESETESVSLNLAYPARLELDVKEDVIESKEELVFDVTARTQADDSISLPLTWRIDNAAGEAVAKGESTSGTTTTVKVAAIPTGEYTLRVAPVDSVMAAAMSRYIVIYNRSLAILPDTTDIIWTPKYDISLADDATTQDITLGVSEPGAYVTIAWINADGKRHVESRQFDAGYHDISFPVSKLYFAPARTRLTDDKCEIYILAARNARVSSQNITLKHQRKDDVNITVESFRDKVFGGDDEKWTVKVTDSKNRPVEAAVVANIHDKRIDALQTPSELYIYRLMSSANSLRLSTPSWYRWNRSIKFRKLKLNTAPEVRNPQWAYLPVIRGRYLVCSSAMGSTRMSSRATMANAKVAMAEATVEEESMDMAAPTAGATADPLEQVEMRTDAPLTLLWSPMLVTNSKGIIEIPFTAPSTSTQWTATLTAWTKELASHSRTLTFTSQKPVMATVNTPRFVRRGDTLTVIATVRNATDSVLEVTGLLEASAPGAARPLSSERSTMRIDGLSSSTLSLTMAVPDSFAADTLWISLRAAGSKFSDGERHAIPVLPSEWRVNDAYNFYLNPGETSFSMELPESRGKEFGMNLTFTGNPMWTVVEALPALYDGAVFPTANSQAAVIFSTSIALGLMEQHPELEYDFDRKALTATRNAAITKLADLQGADGGWQWGPWSRQSSSYITGNVLDLLATLRRTGFYPEKDKKLSEMVAKAVKYYDSKVRDTDMLYTIVRPAFPEVVQSLNGSAVTAKTLQSIVKSWKELPLSMKPEAASALHFNGNTNLARTIMNWVTEYGTQTPTKGFEFKNVRSLRTYAWLLEAYGTILPTSPVVDGLRQYLIVRKQATDWGNSVISSYVVQAMINSGTQWCTPAKAPVIAIDGRPIEATSQGRMGNIETPVSGERLTIATDGTTPAYGAVVASYIAPADSIAAFSDGEVSVEKTLYILRDGKAIAITPATPIKLGDRVQATITLKSSRPMSNVIVSDNRAASFEPVDQMPGYVFGQGVSCYRENRDTATNLYIDYLPQGTFVLSYDLTANNAGTFSSGTATVICTEAPTLTAHSGAATVTVKP